MSESCLWERHILNSAAIVPFIRREIGKTNASIADVGSGGGFPGIVAAACMPEHRFTLIEPMERRVEWLHECVELMGLSNVTVIRARAEEIIAALKRRDAQVRPFDAVTCRAVAPMTKLTGWTLPMLKPQGSLIALKGRSAQVELDKAERVIRTAGGMRARVVVAPVGGDLEPTHVVIVRKR